METWTSPTLWYSSLWQGKYGTRGHGDLLAIPAPFSSMEAGERLGKRWDGLTLVLSGLCDRRAQTPAPGLHGALNTSVMGWEAQGCFSGLPCCWDNAVSGP